MIICFWALCCEKIKISGFEENHNDLMGTFKTISVVVNGRPLWINENDKFLYYNTNDIWMIGSDYNDINGGVMDSSSSNRCPSTISANDWQFSNNGWQSGSLSLECQAISNEKLFCILCWNKILGVVINNIRLWI